MPESGMLTVIPVKVLVFLALMFLPAVIFGQQEPIFGQYLFNNSVINPAQAGSNRQDHFGILVRNQWFGVEGSPKTESAYANLRLPGNLGLAIGIYQDRMGPETNLIFQSDLAYHARLTETWQLAGGIRMLFANTRIFLTNIPNVDPRDPLLQEDLTSGLLMNVGAGLLAYSEKAYIGISSPRLLNSHIEALSSLMRNSHPDVDLKQRIKRHMFAYAGANLAVSDEIAFLPSTIYRFFVNKPMQSDLNFIFGYRDLLDFGPLIRSNLHDRNFFDTVGFMLGLRFLSNWYLGYMYEYPLQSIRYITGQTHEIALRYMLDSRYHRRIGSPRYFL